MPGLAFWFWLYFQLKPFSNYLVYSLLGMEKGGHLAEAAAFFVYDAPKVLMLLTLVVFVVSILRTFVTPEKSRRYLAGKRELGGNILASFLGVATPFCSCSAVPLFMGFVQSGIPLGVTFSFLIAAPMVNEIALILLWGLLGWKIAFLYLFIGIMLAIVAGFVIGKFNLEDWVEDWVKELRNQQTIVMEKKLLWSERINMGLVGVKDIVGKVWVFVLVGIGIGAIIHGYVPEELMIKLMGKDNWWSVPGSILMGVPMYSNAAGIVPVVEALLNKGAGLGAALAFMMSVIGLSLPEIIILRKVLKPKLIAVFVGVVSFGILLVGYFFNFVL